MNNLNRLTMLILISLFMVGCSAQKKPEEREIRLGGSIFNIFGDAFPGGIFLRLEGADGTIIENKMDEEPYNLQIPNGNWKFHVVAFAGPNSYEGALKCASSEPVDLKSEDTTVELNAGSNCSSATHVSMIKIVPNWEQGHWDQAKWAP